MLRNFFAAGKIPSVALSDKNMMLCKKAYVVWFFIGTAFFNELACAQGLEVTIGLEAEQNSNPDNLRSDEDQESEAEYAGRLGVKGEVENRFARWSSDLRYEARRYSDHESRNYELLLGQADLSLGGERSRFTGGVSYTAQEQLINPLAGRTPQNVDFRTVFSAVAALNLGKPSNRLTAYGNAAIAQYDLSNDLESYQYGGGGRYQRATSKTSLFGIDVGGYSLDYKDNPQVSFDYYRASISWQQQLRRLEYNIALGTNTIARLENSTSPYYEALATWREPGNQFTLNFRQWMTDTSQGAGRSEWGAISGNDGRLTIVDQYTFQDASVAWMSSLLCGRCRSTVRLTWQSEDYERFREEDNIEVLGEIDFRYQARPQLMLAFNAQASDYTSDPVDSNGDYQEQRFGVSAKWSRLARRGELGLYALNIARDFDDDAAFDQNVFGIRFDWLLYER